ncbi:MAG: 1,4-alpha-glucan-branching enzyme [Bacteroidetes bacterium]|nr:MAG: 1,4-alpha-glucan-branching enzyme [Bacteroidota bacterium]
MSKTNISQTPSKRKQLAIVANDDWLKPVELQVIYRHERYKAFLNSIEQYTGSLYEFAGGHQFFGINYDPVKKGWWYREWAPAAYSMYLFGDFNNWNRTEFAMFGSESGIWEAFIDEKLYKIEHGSQLKVLVHSANGWMERIPAYITRTVQDPINHNFTGQYWDSEAQKFDWENDNFEAGKLKELLIYECHVGMAQEEEKVGSYIEFADKILPRIHKAGYNAIQMMAVQEHPYYGSFGYHVSNFFAPSSRFGTPEELKYLIKKAHSLGIAVIMDIVHSHAVKNLFEGLNEFDGSDDHYFHSGKAGLHPDWDSKVFNYGKFEVLRFLLSNVRYWLEEFHFDGFRFDGVTSMLYTHHGQASFDHRNKFFKEGVDYDAITYLQLANKLIHDINPHAITIAEDVSGMPGLCRPIDEGGIGFNYRLGMGIPDFWIKLLKERSDDHWNMYEMWHTLNNRQAGVGTVSYAESHDQALVGDKTIAFWLMDKEMYFAMNKESQNLAIDRGVSLHKIIRLFTIALGGQAYLNFIGNEFGHPEWIDFPRHGNGWSYKYARRQWSLRDNPFLRYEHLADFDEAMIHLIKENGVLQDEFAKQLHMDDANKTIIFERRGLIFLFNFHPSNSIMDYSFYLPTAGKYKVILNSDDPKFGGFNRVDNEVEYFTQPDEESGLNVLKYYNINRAALVMKKFD